MKHIRIDAPGAGALIMSKVGVREQFNEALDHSIATFDDNGALLGGFVVCGYTQASMVVHMAGCTPSWCSRELMRVLFSYGFDQLGLRRMLATVSSANTRALELDLRAGWRMEAIIEDAYPDGHMIILSMDRARCKWLEHG